jgi:hypothetical protein
MNEPILTFFMPLTMCVFYTLKFQVDSPENLWGLVLGIASFQWLWAVKNWMVGPLKRDSGLFTWLTIVYGTYLRSPNAATGGCALLGVSHLAVGLKQVSGMFKSKTMDQYWATAAKYFKKSEFFARIFFLYMWAAAGFWLWCASDFYSLIK